jgi:hypothetical protein
VPSSIRNAGFAIAALLVPDAAAAQQPWYLAPSISIAHVYDTNVFVSPFDPKADLVTRVTPGLDMQYERPLLTVDAHYGFDVERFATYSTLNTMIGRQNAVVDVRSRRFRRVDFGANTAVTTTTTPGDLNIATGIAAGRASASRVVAHPSLNRELGRRANATAGYSYTRDRLAGGVHLHRQALMVGFERRESPRAAVLFGYGVERFDFGSRSAATSHFATAGLVRSIGRDTTARLAAGPRLTDGRLEAEVEATFQQKLPNAELQVSYTRTQTTLMGLEGTAGTQRVTAAATYHAGRRLHARVAPGISSLISSRQRILVSHTSVDASVTLTRNLTLVAAFDTASQRTRDVLRPVPPISRRLLSINLVVAPRTRRS